MYAIFIHFLSIDICWNTNAPCLLQIAHITLCADNKEEKGNEKRGIIIALFSTWKMFLPEIIIVENFLLKFMIKSEEIENTLRLGFSFAFPSNILLHVSALIFRLPWLFNVYFFVLQRAASRRKIGVENLADFFCFTLVFCGSPKILFLASFHEKCCIIFWSS